VSAAGKLYTPTQIEQFRFWVKLVNEAHAAGAHIDENHWDEAKEREHWLATLDARDAEIAALREIDRDGLIVFRYKGTWDVGDYAFETDVIDDPGSGVSLPEALAVYRAKAARQRTVKP
jgi:hypothetical protein